MGQFSDFLGQAGIDQARLLRVSRLLESRQDEDRALVRRRAEKRRSNAGQSYADVGIAKPRSGRPLRPGHVEAAMADRPVPGPVRTKFVRAVNAILQKKGQEPVNAPRLFGAVPSRQGKKPR